MRYHIDTISVWDALKQGSDCILCALRRKTERSLLQRTLGSSLMSPDRRKETNSTGFCQNHQVMLYSLNDGNRLGHALMMLTHLEEVKAKLQSIRLQMEQSKGKKLPIRISKLGAMRSQEKNAGMMALEQVSGRCVLCEEMRSHSDRQAVNLLHLWKSDADFRSEFSLSKGLCLPDTASLIAIAPEYLSGELLTGFQSALQDMLGSSLDSLHKDLTLYTQKFDYRNANEPWNNTKDALERTINKLRGWCLGDEPLQDEHS